MDLGGPRGEFSQPLLPAVPEINSSGVPKQEISSATMSLLVRYLVSAVFLCVLCTPFCLFRLMTSTTLGDRCLCLSAREAMEHHF